MKTIAAALLLVIAGCGGGGELPPAERVELFKPTTAGLWCNAPTTYWTLDVGDVTGPIVACEWKCAPYGGELQGVHVDAQLAPSGGDVVAVSVTTKPCP